jgi:hypothetical protein
MLTYEDCLALCGLTEEEVMAIAEHEHIPEILATEVASYLEHCPDGSIRIRKIIGEDIALAEASGRHAHAEDLRRVLRHYIATHRRRRASNTAAAG